MHRERSSRNRRSRKKVLTPAILAGIGVALGIAARVRSPCHRDVTVEASPAVEGNEHLRPALNSAQAAGMHRERSSRNRRSRKKVLTPAILAGIGVALGIAAILLYPSRNELPVPPYSTLHLYSALPISTVTYQVHHMHPDMTEIKISVLLPVGENPPAGTQADLRFFPPVGTTFRACLIPSAGTKEVIIMYGTSH
jgi:hypothetical protein